MWNADSSEVLSTCADPVNCTTVLGKIECIFKNGYSIKMNNSVKTNKLSFYLFH